MRSIMFTLILATMLLISGLFVLTASADNDSVPTDTRATSHTVFAEDITATWCVHCTSASEELEVEEQKGTYDFRYVALIDDRVQDAADRIDEYNPTGFPTVEFDGGYDEVVGNQSSAGTSNYDKAIDNCETRTVPDLDVSVACQDQGSGKLVVSVSVENKGTESYSGTLKAYVVERVSRYIDYGGHYYNNALIGFAVDESISVGLGETYKTTSTWDGGSKTDLQGGDFSDIDDSNIDIYAVTFQSKGEFKKHSGLNAKTFTAHYVDGFGECQPVEPTGGPQISITNPSEGSVVSSMIDVTVMVTSDSTLDSVQIKTGSGDYVSMTGSGSSYSYSWDTTTVSNGETSISIKAVDVFDSAESATLDVTVSNEATGASDLPPVVVSHSFDPVAPTSADHIKFTVVIDPRDATISGVKVQICQGTMCSLPAPMSDLGSNTYEYTADPYPATVLDFTVIISHDKGDAVTEEWEITVTQAAADGTDGTDGNTGTDGSETDPSQSSPGSLPATIVGATLLAIAVLAVLGRRR